PRTPRRTLLPTRRSSDLAALLGNQLTILADKKAKNEDIGEGAALTVELRVQQGMTLAALGRRAEAETMLLDSVPQLPARTAASRSEEHTSELQSRGHLVC